MAAVVQSEQTDGKLQHARLGHPSMSTVKHINFLQNTVTDVSSITDCPICPLAKQSRLPFPSSTSKSSHALKLLHIDIWGPYKTPTYHKKQYFLTTVDDMSRYTWVFLMQFKTGVIVVLKKFLSMIKTQFSAIVKIIRSDNGIEFLNVKYNEMLDSYGIIHQSSCAYIPQQNGVVKRKHRHILDVTRALKFQAGIPTRFSGRMYRGCCLCHQQTSNYCAQWEMPI